MVFTAPLPYVAFMIVDFHMAADVDTAGYEAGWITGMFMVGRFIAGRPYLLLINLKLLLKSTLIAVYLRHTMGHGS